ncbi:MAG: bifunctional methylenetetrahydrofolate dehydrogenase/methenyltetrahydrofolate cyclohydrolase FolD, partial [Chloroflexi bacterium]|nr:bifunctional methylenetetrahydrofolate dehydrogenase/methenyltetrahydrofolate cyclohydrolase FolD [Chloroflexota bacterium]
IKNKLKVEVAELKKKHNLTPGLATVLVGDDPASHSYVGGKRRTCEALGILSDHHGLPADTSEEEVLALVEKLNKDSRIHGILVQLPLPKHINETRVLYTIDPSKDVDGFHPVNVGKLVIGESPFPPCTPQGIQELIISSGVKTEGAEVVVVGRSNIVGKPIANMMLQKQKGANATVTVCHSRTADIATHTRRADILIAAIGQPKFINGDMVKEGAVVIDVGTNEVGKTAEGKRILVGDVDFDSVKEKAGFITPVPGGVGPMTITMLMVNTVKAAKLSV